MALLRCTRAARTVALTARDVAHLRTTFRHFPRASAFCGPLMARKAAFPPAAGAPALPSFLLHTRATPGQAWHVALGASGTTTPFPTTHHLHPFPHHPPAQDLPPTLILCTVWDGFSCNTHTPPNTSLSGGTTPGMARDDAAPTFCLPGALPAANSPSAWGRTTPTTFERAGHSPALRRRAWRAPSTNALLGHFCHLRGGQGCFTCT